MSQPNNQHAVPCRDGHSSWRHGISAVDNNDDTLYMYTFKVLACNQKIQHDWSSCCYAHPQEKAARRDPRRYSYGSVACPDMLQSGKCPRGSACHMAHSVFEYWLHPQRYRTSMCRDGANCKRVTCFFAHSDSQLRTNTGAPAGDGTDPFAAAKLSLSGQRRARVKQQLSGQPTRTSLDSGSGSYRLPACTNATSSPPCDTTSLDLGTANSLGGAASQLPLCQGLLPGWSPTGQAFTSSLVNTSTPPVLGRARVQMSGPADRSSMDLGFTRCFLGYQATLPGWEPVAMQRQGQLSGPVFSDRANMDLSNASSLSSIHSTSVATSSLGLNGRSSSLTLSQGAGSNDSSLGILQNNMSSLLRLESRNSSSLGLPLSSLLPAASLAVGAVNGACNDVTRLNDLLGALQAQAVTSQQQVALAEAAAEEAANQLQAMYAALGMPVDTAAAAVDSSFMPTVTLGFCGMLGDSRDVNCTSPAAAVNHTPASSQMSNLQTSGDFAIFGPHSPSCAGGNSAGVGPSWASPVCVATRNELDLVSSLAIAGPQAQDLIQRLLLLAQDAATAGSGTLQ